MAEKVWSKSREGFPVLFALIEQDQELERNGGKVAEGNLENRNSPFIQFKG